MLIDSAQATDSRSLAKLVKHPHIRHGVAVRQMSEVAPSLLFGKHLHQQIKGVDRRQHAQQMHAPQLSGIELAASALPAMGRQ